MSQWTHIVGAIRVDGLVQDKDTRDSELKRIRKILGPMCLYEKWNERSTLPRGSEGSLQYLIHEYHTGLPWLIITIWGDLRDFGSKDDIASVKEWWNKTLKELNWIRDAVLHIYVEGKRTTILRKVG